MILKDLPDCITMYQKHPDPVRNSRQVKVQKRATLEMTWPKCFDERTTLIQLWPEFTQEYNPLNR